MAFDDPSDDRPSLERFQLVRATFHPWRTDDLSPGAEAFIGQRFVFMVATEIESGQFKGQLRLDTPLSWRGVCWVPLCDLREIVIDESPEARVEYWRREP